MTPPESPSFDSDSDSHADSGCDSSEAVDANESIDEDLAAGASETPNALEAPAPAAAAKGAPVLPVLDHASCTDPGRRRLANEDAVHAEARLGLFVVCDGVGGRPAGEAASNLVAFALPHLFKRRLRDFPREQYTVDAPGTLLARAAVDASAALRRAASEHIELKGMMCTLVSCLFDADRLLVVAVGDSRAYLLRERRLSPLTQDDTRDMARLRQNEEGHWIRGEGDRRLLVQSIGAPRSPKPEVRRLAMRPGDRIMLCTDGLTDPLSERRAGKILADGGDPMSSAKALVEAANHRGGPDNITVSVIDFKGTRPLTDADRAAPARPAERGPGQAPARAMKALERLQVELAWLHGHAESLKDLGVIPAAALVKRELGREVASKFLKMHPADAPAAVFHRACATPNSAWRQRYDSEMANLQTQLDLLIRGDRRLSPLLTASETALILNRLWNGWRRVERQYFATCERPELVAGAGIHVGLPRRIAHMLESAQTIAGLLRALPGFGRLEPKDG